MRAIMIFALLALAGCAITPAPERQWYKKGASEEDFQRALAGCRVQGAMVPQSNDGGVGGTLFQTAIMMQTVDNCMRAQGYILR